MIQYYGTKTKEDIITIEKDEVQIAPKEESSGVFLNGVKWAYSIKSEERVRELLNDPKLEC